MLSLLTNNSYKNQSTPDFVAGCRKAMFFLLVLYAFKTTEAQGVFKDRPGAKNMAPQSFTNVTEGTYFIKVNQTGKFLGVEGISTNNGARLVEWDFFNQDNHKFVVKKANEPGYYTIMAVHSGKYLNVEGANTNDGARIIQWDYVNQDNLKWAFVYNKILNGLTIINKQTGKAISLSGSINNALNGTVVTLNGSSDGTQYFSLVPVENAVANTNIRNRTAGGDNLPAKLLTQYVYLNLPDGSRIKRSINTTGNPISSAIKKRTSDVKRIVKVSGGNTDDCKTYTANASTVEQNDYMIVSNSSMMLNFAPGLIYDIGDLFSGNLMDRAKFPYGQSRAPMELITSVKNLANPKDSVAKIVTIPDIGGLNQAVAGFYQSATTSAAKTSAENVRFYACEVNSTTEMALKIGGGGHYLFFSAGSDLQINNSTEYRTMYIEGVKELFSITARPAKEGSMFLQDPGNTGNLGYISSVSYGVRIVGKVEITNIKDATTASMQTSFNMGFAGADIKISDFKASSNAKTKVTLYAVGGRADAIGTCTVDNIQATIDNYLKTVNYQVAQPIKLKCSTLDGKLISFVDATDNFTYTVCEPAALKNAGLSVNVKDLRLIGENDHNNDFDLYGKVFVKAFDVQNREIPAINNTNMLMDVRGANNIDMSEPNQRTFETNNVASFYFPPGTARGSYLVVYYGLFDQDANEDYGTGDDDQFSYRNGGDPDKNCDLGPSSTRLCSRRINLDNFGSSNILGVTDNLWNTQDGTGLQLRYNIQKISDPVSQ